MQMALKCADICNPCRPWELSKQWSEKVTAEFFRQGTPSFSSIPALLILLSSTSSSITSYGLSRPLAHLSGDVEKKHKLEVSPLCDNEVNSTGNIQIGKNWDFELSG